MSYVSDLILDDAEPSFQLYFGNEEVLKTLGESGEKLATDIFKSTKGNWVGREKDKQKTEFFKIRLLSEDLIAFRFPDLWEKIFIGRNKKFRDYTRFQVLDIGFFDVGKPFHTEEFYIQVGSDKFQNFFGNNSYFYSNIWEKWESSKSYRVGEKPVLEQSEIRAVQKVNSELKPELKKAQKTKSVSKNSDSSLLWSGKNLKDFGVSESSFEKFREAVLNKVLESKDEFETTSELLKREKIFDSVLLNSYLGSQEVEMKYDAENSEFGVKVKFWSSLSIDFKIEVPRNIAKEFKQSVKNFDFYFSKELTLESVSKDFKDKRYSGKFKKFDLKEFES